MNESRKVSNAIYDLFKIFHFKDWEYAALRKIQTTASERQSDGVARQEVRLGVRQAEQLLDDTLAQAFDVGGKIISLYFLCGSKV